jgi:hypothetical protein
MEKGLIDIPGYEYLPAHEFASLGRHRVDPRPPRPGLLSIGAQI